MGVAQEVDRNRLAAGNASNQPVRLVENFLCRHTWEVGGHSDARQAEECGCQGEEDGGVAEPAQGLRETLAAVTTALNHARKGYECTREECALFPVGQYAELAE